MATITLEVCKCCAMTEAHITEAIGRLRAAYGERLSIVERRCLDVCQDSGAVKVGDEVLVLRPGDIPAFEEKVRQALQSDG